MNIKEKAKAYANSIAQNEERKKYCEEDFIAGVEWAINKAYSWLVYAMWYDDIYGLGTNGNENNVSEFLMSFKSEMKGDSE